MPDKFGKCLGVYTKVPVHGVCRVEKEGTGMGRKEIKWFFL